MNITQNNIIEITLTYLPGYAEYLLLHKKELFAETFIKNAYALNIPLLKYFDTLKPEERFRISMDSNTRLLTALQLQNIEDYIETSRQNWVNNQLPVVAKDQVVVEDISLVNFARKKTFFDLLHHYTTDPLQLVEIVQEIGRFMLALESVMFKTYIKLQQDELQRTNDELQKSEHQLLEAQSLARIGSFEWDLTGNSQSTYTPEIIKIFEFEKVRDLESFMTDVHPDDRLKLQASIEKAMHDGNYECEYRYKRFQEKILYTRGKVFFEKGKPVKMVGTIADITERAQLISKLQESEELSKQAHALTNTGNWKWLLDRDEIEWSDEMYRIYGMQPYAEKITFNRFLTFIHDDDRSRRIDEITNALKTGKASDYIMKIITKKGEEKILKGKSQVIIDKNNTIIGMLGTCQDITYEFKLTAELKKKNEELVRKNKDLESFNFIANHDLQEPLRKIQLYSNRILHDGTELLPENLLKNFKKISQASCRMQKNLADFLVFYQGFTAQEDPYEFQIGRLMDEIRLEFAEIISQKSAELTIQDTSPVYGVKARMKQMLKHLISNALKFSKKGEPSRILVTSSTESMADGNTYIKLTIKDNGIGFDPKYSERIFELFQRLHNKDEYSGSGIGLSLCKKIAEEHRGWITAVSEPGVGTEFSVFLPRK